MEKNPENWSKIKKALDEIVKLMKHSIAIQLYCAGASQDEIKKNLRLGKSTVNKMVLGIKKEKK